MAGEVRQGVVMKGGVWAVEGDSERDSNQKVTVNPDPKKKAG